LEGETITFKKEFSSLGELEAQVGRHEGYIEIGESGYESPIVASKALPGKVGSETMTIAWTWTVEVEGYESPVTQSLGSSSDDLYLTFAEPAVAPCKTVEEAKSVVFPTEEEGVVSPCTPIYFSSLYVGATSVEAAKPTEAADIADVWARFTDKKLLPVAQRLHNPPLAVPTIKRPRWTRATGSFGPPIIFKYYTAVPSFQTALALAPWSAGGWAVLGGCTTLDAMLADGSGRCGAFAEWLNSTFASQGIASNMVHVVVKFPAGACKVNEPLVCVMLVKDWSFAGAGTSGEGAFPFTVAEVTDQLGVAGQGVENPPPYFWDHAIVKAGGGPGGAPRQLFDPSYGTGPINGATPDARLQTYQTAAIAGFCRPSRLLNSPAGTTLAQAQMKAPLHCVKVPPAPPAPGAQLLLGTI
jgi:hypothetical protein